ncbi:hypothetical protein K443DRAFT_681860 [Laccaria amethystina LaAM-08-1]|uniref:Uncharacterized protein n=1 Tax=Laccaria amethystina LaAM-08-1 TaxID=1095629 RepID=A0A0C9WL53_9AGAR|nr:hypothetical protein K443DRAFT_681860 [Laccaria amethystina LaAM-08-1]
MSSSSDSLFYTLSNHVQRRIDEAFDVVSKDVGAIVEADDDKSSDLQIPLTLIPAALQYLDLPLDDPEICSIFRNAASGWSSSSPNICRNEEFVSRDDWRAVCAVLLEHGGEDDEGPLDSLPRAQILGSSEEDEGESGSYRESDYDSAESTTGDLDEEYIEGETSCRKPGGHRKAELLSLSTKAVDTQKLTAHQRQACLDAFALFFPDASPFELPEKKIMMKDIQRVASLLKEKIKVEEMVEMLDMFSSSAERSVTLMDFSCMMVMTRLM